MEEKTKYRNGEGTPPYYASRKKINCTTRRPRNFCPEKGQKIPDSE